MTYDLVVLGGGARALVTAAGAARSGRRVVLATEAPVVGGELLTVSFLSPFRFDVGGGLVRGLDAELARVGLPFLRVASPFSASLVGGGTGLLAHALADEVVSHGGLVLEGCSADGPAVEAGETVDAREREPDGFGRVFLGLVGETGLPELGVVPAPGGYAVVRTDDERPRGPLVSVTWTGAGPQDSGDVVRRLGLDPGRLAFALAWQPDDLRARRY
jgi:hypothetical protein